MSKFSLQGYFQYIGIDHAVIEVSLSFLSKLITHHLICFPYQNNYLFEQGKIPAEQRTIKSLHKDDLYQQMVVEKTPGYCFQNTELLATVLMELGFKVEKYIARVINQLTGDVNEELVKKLQFTHEILVVTLDEKEYLLDTAFAHNSIRKPLLFELGQIAVENETYQLIKVEEEIRLSFKLKDGWLSLYQISSSPSTQEAVDAANKNLYDNTMCIPIRDNFILVGSTTPEKRRCITSLVNGPTFYKSISDSKIKHRELLPNNLETLVLEKFGFSLSKC